MILPDHRSIPTFKRRVKSILNLPNLRPKRMEIHRRAQINASLKTPLELLQLLRGLLGKLGITSILNANTCFDHVRAARIEDLQIRKTRWWALEQLVGG